MNTVSLCRIYAFNADGPCSLYQYRIQEPMPDEIDSSGLSSAIIKDSLLIYFVAKRYWRKHLKRINQQIGRGAFIKEHCHAMLAIFWVAWHQGAMATSWSGSRDIIYFLNPGGPWRDGGCISCCSSMSQTATEASNNFWQDFKAERQCKEMKRDGIQRVGLALIRSCSHWGSDPAARSQTKERPSRMFR